MEIHAIEYYATVKMRQDILRCIRDSVVGIETQSTELPSAKREQNKNAQLPLLMF